MLASARDEGEVRGRRSEEERRNMRSEEERRNMRGPSALEEREGKRNSSDSQLR